VLLVLRRGERLIVFHFEWVVFVGEVILAVGIDEVVIVE